MSLHHRFTIAMPLVVRTLSFEGKSSSTICTGGVGGHRFLDAKPPASWKYQFMSHFVDLFISAFIFIIILFLPYLMHPFIYFFIHFGFSQFQSSIVKCCSCGCISHPDLTNVDSDKVRTVYFANKAYNVR